MLAHLINDKVVIFIWHECYILYHIDNYLCAILSKRRFGYAIFQKQMKSHEPIYVNELINLVLYGKTLCSFTTESDRDIVLIWSKNMIRNKTNI